MTPHVTNRCPVHPDTPVSYRLKGDPEARQDLAGNLFWGPGAGPAGEGRIAEYTPLVSAGTQQAQRLQAALHTRDVLARLVVAGPASVANRPASDPRPPSC